MSAQDETRAIGLILVAALAYSFLPVLAVYSLETLPPLVYVAKSFIQYSILQAIVWMVLRLRLRGDTDIVLRSFRHNIRNYAAILISGVLIAVSYSCLLMSFQFINKASASVLYETWPILVTIGLPLIMSQRFERLTAANLVSVGLSFVGIAIVINSSAETALSSLNGFSAENASVVGYLTALASGATMAAAVIIKANLMKALKLNRSAIPFVVFIEGSHRLLGGLVALAISLIVTRVGTDELLHFDVSTIFAVVELIGATAFWFAILATRRSIINILWYLSPLLAVTWLSLLGLARLEALTVLSASLIIIANVMADRRANAR